MVAGPLRRAVPPASTSCSWTETNLSSSRPSDIAGLRGDCASLLALWTFVSCHEERLKCNSINKCNTNSQESNQIALQLELVLYRYGLTFNAWSKRCLSWKRTEYRHVNSCDTVV